MVSTDVKAAVKSDTGSPPLRSGVTYQKTIKASPLSLANVPIPNKQDVRHEPSRTACATAAAEGSTLLHSKRRPPTHRDLHTQQQQGPFSGSVRVYQSIVFQDKGQSLSCKSRTLQTPGHESADVWLAGKALLAVARVCLS